MVRRLVLVSQSCFFIVCVAATARADLHTWDINEIFSSADGSVQFIELQERNGLNGQHKLSSSTLFPNHTLTSSANSNVFTFLTDLPSSATANKFFLMATANFASLPGGVTPDYIIPANFFHLTADTLSFSGNIDTFSFTAGQLPLDGVHSRQDNNTSPINSPRNFAGQQGSVVVPEPSGNTLCLVGLLMLAGMLLIAWRPARARR